jgi:CHAT domain-containing protein
MDILKKIFPQADYYVAENISPADLQKLTGIYDIIHFAPGDYFMKETPLDPGLPPDAAWPRNGCRSGRDIARLQLAARTTVFGGCRPERVVSSADTGMQSLVAAWLYAVSPSVVATLWRVEDQSRAAWVEIFYKNLEKNDNMAEALRAAQNEMIQKGYGPSEWAAFTLIGRH